MSSARRYIRLHPDTCKCIVACINREAMKNPLFPKKAPSSRLLPAMPVLIQYLGFDQRAEVKVVREGGETLLKQSFPDDVPRRSQEDHEKLLRELSPQMREVSRTFP